MQHIPTETSPRTGSPRFDCELPDDVLDELLAPKRPRILGRPSNASDRRRGLVLAVLALVLVAAGVVVVFWSWQRPTVVPVVQSTTPAVAQPTPAASAALSPGWNTDGTASGRAGVIPEVRRAELVKLPTPRATLVALPEWRVGETRRLMMPYGLEVVGRLRGHSDDELNLPTTGNTIGDTWLVEGVPWIWICAPGASTAAWIDP